MMSNNETNDKKYLKPLGCKTESGLVGVFKGIAVLIWTVGIIAGIVEAIALNQAFDSFYYSGGGGQGILVMFIIWIGAGVSGLMPYSLAIIISSLQTIQNQGYEITDQKPENAMVVIPKKAAEEVKKAEKEPELPAEQPKKDEPVSGGFCPVCGKPLSPNARFCNGCGTKVQ